MSTATVRGIPMTNFREERWRFLSFRFYPLTAVMHAAVLAINGFFYSGSGQEDEVTCYFCGQRHGGWQNGDQVEAIHRQISPNCPIVTGAPSGNIPMTQLFDSHNSTTEGIQRTNFNSSPVELVRTDSQEEPTTSQSPEHLQTSTPEVARAPVSPATLSSSNVTSEVPDTPAAPASQGPQTPAAGSSNRTYSELAIITEQPKRPEYRVRAARQQTFSQWPSQHHMSVDELTDAGFYFAGYGDCTRCFFCGGGLRNWDVNDNAWVEHARWFPRCGFMKQAKGTAFISAVKRLNDQGREVISYSDVVRDLDEFSMEEEVRSLESDPAVRSVVEVTGYDLQEVVQAAESMVQSQGESDWTSEDLFRSLAENSNMEFRPSASQESVVEEEVIEESIRQTRAQIQQLRRERRCKVCLDKEVAVIFLPCGHLVTCHQCASSCDRCPVCRQGIRGVVRASIPAPPQSSLPVPSQSSMSVVTETSIPTHTETLPRITSRM